MAMRSQVSKKTSQSAAQQVQPTLRSRPFAPPLKPEAEQVPLDLQTQLENAQRFGHHFGQYRISPRASALPPIQTKLTIGAPGDKYEQEADRIAKQVVQQLQEPTVGRSQPNPDVQREILPEEEDELQMKSNVLQREILAEEEDELQMKSVAMQAPGAIAASEELEGAITQARGSGQPITETIRKQMEQSFGADFSGVRIHTDPQADQLNRSIQARAFTTGQDVFFRQGAYQPGSRGGEELLAHELTHVIQQKGEIERSSPHPPQQHMKPGNKMERPWITENPEKVIQRVAAYRVEYPTYKIEISGKKIIGFNGNADGKGINISFVTDEHATHFASERKENQLEGLRLVSFQIKDSLWDAIQWRASGDVERNKVKTKWVDKVENLKAPSWSDGKKLETRIKKTALGFEDRWLDVLKAGVEGKATVFYYGEDVESLAANDLVYAYEEGEEENGVEMSKKEAEKGEWEVITLTKAKRLGYID